MAQHPSPNPTQRGRSRLLWWALLGAGLLAAGAQGNPFAPDEGSAAACAATAPLTAADGRRAAADASGGDVSTDADRGVLALDRLSARSEPLPRGAIVDLFAPAAPARPAAALSASAPPPRVQAPRFPYNYLGALVDDGQRTGFFGRGDTVLALRAGDVVDGRYRIDSVGATSLTLTYLPLDERQVLAFGAAP